MAWKVESLNQTVRDELNNLSQDLRAKYLRIAELLETFGPQLIHEPHVKFIGDAWFPLWEMRMSGKTQIARAVYVTHFQDRIVVLYVFIKKTQKTPRAALAMARQRYSELLDLKTGAPK